MATSSASNEHDDRENSQEKKHFPPCDGFFPLDDFRIADDLLAGPGSAFGNHYPASGNDKITGRAYKASKKNHDSNFRNVKHAPDFELVKIDKVSREPDAQAKGKNRDADEVCRKKSGSVLFVRFKDFLVHARMYSLPMDVLIVP